MSEYETEDQQIEALKKWLKENLASIVFGLAVGLAAVGGWHYYRGQQNSHAIKASNLYMEAAQLVAFGGKNDNVIEISNQLDNDFADTPYAAITSLLLARTEYKKGNLDNAVTQLQWAVKHASTDPLKQLAILRISRVLIEQKKLDKAMSYLKTEHPSVYDAQYAELKGDVYVARGQLAEARGAYDKAISLSGGNKWLILKRQNLGESNNPDEDQSKTTATVAS